jgi:hypothetical protein
MIKTMIFHLSPLILLIGILTKLIIGSVILILTSPLILINIVFEIIKVTYCIIYYPLCKTCIQLLKYS